MKDTAEQLIERILPLHAGKIKAEVLLAERAFFELSSDKHGVLTIRGNSPISIASGLKYFLRKICHCSFSWLGFEGKISEELPILSEIIRKESPHDIVYYLNYCTFGYSMVWWDWARWEKELDWMAMNGVNLALMIVGQEAVWERVLQHYKYTESEILRWLCLPSHVPWQWMANLHSFGGPVSRTWVDTHLELGQKIVRRMRDLGIEPIFQGYYGILPENFQDRVPGAKIFPQGKWVKTLDRPSMLDPMDPEFEKFSLIFYQEQEKLFGKAKYLAADPFHEGGITKGIDITAVARKIQSPMLKYNPESVWVIQGWMENPKPELLRGLEKTRALILDLYCEKVEQWKSSDSFQNTPWIFNIIHNFGGNPGIFGDLSLIANNLQKAITNKKRIFLKGVGCVMEAIEQNEVIYELN